MKSALIKNPLGLEENAKNKVSKINFIKLQSDKKTIIDEKGKKIM